MSDILLILLSAALVNNIVVDQVIGANPLLASIRRHDIARGLSKTMLIVLPGTVALATVITDFLLVPLKLQYLQTFIFVLLIILVIYGLKAWSKKWHNSLYLSDVSIFLPLAGFNTTVLGTLLLNQQQGYHLFSAIFFALGTAVGFTIVLAISTAINSRLEVSDVPRSFQGLPIMLITWCLMSIAFSGYAGF